MNTPDPLFFEDAVQMLMLAPEEGGAGLRRDAAEAVIRRWCEQHPQALSR